MKEQNKRGKTFIACAQRLNIVPMQMSFGITTLAIMKHTGSFVSYQLKPLEM